MFNESIINDMIVNGAVYRINDYKLCVMYGRVYNCFIWCDENGQPVTECIGHKVAVKQVIFSPKLFGTYTKII